MGPWLRLAQLAPVRQSRQARTSLPAPAGIVGKLQILHQLAEFAGTRAIRPAGITVQFADNGGHDPGDVEMELKSRPLVVIGHGHA